MSDEYSIHGRFLTGKLDAAGYEDKMAYERAREAGELEAGGGRQSSQLPRPWPRTEDGYCSCPYCTAIRAGKL